MADFVPSPRTPATTVSGSRGPENIVSQRVIADVSDEIALYAPSASPFMTLTSKLRGKRKTTQYRFDWLEKDEYPGFATLSAASALGDTTIDLQTGEGARFAADDTMINTRTREVVLVTSVSTDTLTVVRGNTLGTGGESDMNIGDTLVLLGRTSEDGSGIGSLRSTVEVDKFNYTQIVKTPFGFTGRDMNTDLFGGRDPITEKKFWGIEHARRLEYFMWFGRRASRTGTGGHLQTFMGGVESYLVSNVWNLGNTTPTERAFVDFLEEAMRWGRGGYENGSSTKYFFHSARWGTEIEFWAKDRLRLLQNESLSKLGLKLKSYESTHGTVVFVPTPAFDRNHQDMAALIDLNHVRYAYHQGRDTRLLTDQQANDVDGESLQYLTDCSVQVELEGAHAWVKGLK